MRWWLQTNERAFSVDNALILGMDFSALPRDLWMIQWIEGRGEIEYQTKDKRNLNGLRTKFTDITPYVPLFTQFMHRMQAKRLLEQQAKAIQIDLIKQIFETKRQEPYRHPIGAGTYNWDASDEVLVPSSTALLLSVIVAHHRGHPQLPYVQLIPMDMVEPLELTIDEVMGIIEGIAARTFKLISKRDRKIAEVSSLVEMHSVIEYDVLAGWT